MQLQLLSLVLSLLAPALAGASAGFLHANVERKSLLVSEATESNHSLFKIHHKAHCLDLKTLANHDPKDPAITRWGGNYTKAAIGSRNGLMTAEFCHCFCAAHKTVHFALQKGTDCYCFDKYEVRKPARPGKCDMHCPGRKKESCGGDFKYEVHLMQYIWKDSAKGPAACGDPAEYAEPPLPPSVLAVPPPPQPGKTKTVEIRLCIAGISNKAIGANYNMGDGTYLEKISLNLQASLAKVVGVPLQNVKMELKTVPCGGPSGITAYAAVTPTANKSLEYVLGAVKNAVAVQAAVVGGLKMLPIIKKVSSGALSVKQNAPKVEARTSEWIELFSESKGDGNGKEFDNSDERTLNFPILSGTSVEQGNYWVRLEWAGGKYIQFLVPKGSNIFRQDAKSETTVTKVSTSANFEPKFGEFATFCHACTKDGFKWGASCWGITPRGDTNRKCGCSGLNHAGQGIYYGGYKKADTCTGAGGGFAGPKKDGEAKGGLAGQGLKFSIATPSPLPFAARPGLKEEVYYFKQLDKMADLDKKMPATIRTATLVNFPKTAKKWKGFAKADHFAVKWTGVLVIGKAGVYTFALESDDGSKLYIDDALTPSGKPPKRVVLNNDGLHAMRKQRAPAHFRSGQHHMKLEYFDKTGASGCIFMYKGPDTKGKMIVVPQSAFRKVFKGTLNDKGSESASKGGGVMKIRRDVPVKPPKKKAFRFTLNKEGEKGMVTVDPKGTFTFDGKKQRRGKWSINSQLEFALTWDDGTLELFRTRDDGHSFVGLNQKDKAVFIALRLTHIVYEKLTTPIRLEILSAIKNAFVEDMGLGISSHSIDVELDDGGDTSLFVAVTLRPESTVLQALRGLQSFKGGGHFFLGMNVEKSPVLMGATGNKGLKIVKITDPMMHTKEAYLTIRIAVKNLAFATVKKDKKIRAAIRNVCNTVFTENLPLGVKKKHVKVTFTALKANSFWINVKLRPESGIMKVQNALKSFKSGGFMKVLNHVNQANEIYNVLEGGDPVFVRGITVPVLRNLENKKYTLVEGGAQPWWYGFFKHPVFFFARRPKPLWVGEITLAADGSAFKQEGVVDKRGRFSIKEGGRMNGTWDVQGRYMMMVWKDKSKDTVYTINKGRTWVNPRAFQMEIGAGGGRSLPKWWKAQFKKHWEPLMLKGHAVKGSPGSQGLDKPVDGIKSKHNLPWSKCGHLSGDGPGPSWWGVDLGSVQSVREVILYNRNDGLPQYLQGVDIHLGNRWDSYKRNPKVAENIKVDAKSPLAIQIIPTVGQYLFVVKKKGPLTVCEVEVIVAVVDGLREEVFYFKQGNKIPSFKGRDSNVDRGVPSINYPQSATKWPKFTQATNFAARWSGYMIILTNGMYTFSLTSDDGSRLIVNMAEVVDNNGVHSKKEVSGKKMMSSGQQHIRIEYFQQLLAACMIFKYKGPDTVNNFIVVPETILKAPANSVRSEPLVAEGFTEEIFYFKQEDKLPDLTGRLPDMVRTRSSVNYPLVTGKNVWKGFTRSNNFAVRWSSRMFFRKPGLYKFSLNSAGGSMLYFDHKKIVNNDGVHLLREKVGSTKVTKGRHRVRIEYFDKTGGAACSFKYLGFDTGDEWAVVSMDAKHSNMAYITFRLLNLDYSRLVKNKPLLKRFMETFQRGLKTDIPMGPDVKLKLSKGPLKGFVLATARVKPPADVTDAMWGYMLKSFMGGGKYVIQRILNGIPKLKEAMKGGKVRVTNFKLLGDKDEPKE